MYTLINAWLHMTCYVIHYDTRMYVQVDLCCVLYEYSLALCTCKEPQFVHACLCEIYPGTFVVLHALAEVITREVL